MKKYCLLLGAATLLLTSACQKDEVETTTDEIVFGSFYGECGGERCIERYKLDFRTQHLYEDISDQYPQGATPLAGTFVQRHDSLFAKVQGLAAQLPAQLLAQPNGVIGQPDAGDWGGYYLEVRRSGRQQVWLIDTHKNNLPPYLHPFVDQLQNQLRLIP